MPLSVTHIAAHAVDFHSKEIADAVLDHNLLSAWLKASGRVRVVDGGETFHEKILYSELGGADWISKDGEIPLSYTDHITDAEFQIKVLAAPLKVYHLDMSKASGESKVADIVESVIHAAKTTMSNKMGAAAFNDGSNANAMHGVQKLISTTAGETVGGIDSSSYTWWDNQRNTTGTSGFNTSQAGIGLMTDMMNDCAQSDADRPDLIVTTSAVWSLFMRSTTNITRLVDTKVGALGYKALDFMGTPVGWDTNCPTGYMYFINSNYMKLRLLNGGDFVTSDWDRVQGQLADYCTMHVYGQFTVSNRSKLGVVSSITG